MPVCKLRENMKENVYFCLNETNYDFSMDIAEEVGILFQRLDNQDVLS